MDYIDTERLMLVWNCASSTEISVGCFFLPLKVFSRVKFYHYHFVPIWMKLDKQDEISHEMGILANPNPPVHLKAADCCSKLGLGAPRREMLHLMSPEDELWPMPRVNTPPSSCLPGAQPGCASLGGVCSQGIQAALSWGPLHSPQPQTQWDRCEKQLPQLHFQAQVLHSWQRCLMDPTFWLSVLQWDGGDKQPHPSRILGCSRCCAAHSPPRPLFMTVVLKAMAVLVLLLLPSNSVY